MLCGPKWGQSILGGKVTGSDRTSASGPMMGSRGGAALGAIPAQALPFGVRMPAPACSLSPAVYIILSRGFLLSAVILSFLNTLIMVSFASQLFPRTQKYSFVSAFISFFTGVDQAGRPCPQAGSHLGEDLGGLYDVRGKEFKASFLGCLLYEVSHPLRIYDSSLLGLFSTPHFQLVQPLPRWLGAICLGVFLPELSQ